MSWFGELLENVGGALGDAGVRWKCANCGNSSRDYTGNLVDGTARCPNCGKNPVVRESSPPEAEHSLPPAVPSSGEPVDLDLAPRGDHYQTWYEGPSYGTPSYAEQHTTPPKQTDMPVLHQLSFMEYRGQQVRVIDDVAPEWDRLALRFHFSFATIKTIKQGVFYQPIEGCREMFHQWLGGKGLKPATWNTLIVALRDIDLSALADILDNVIAK